MMRPDEAPINMFSARIDLIWTVVWWTCNYFPYNIPGRIARFPPVLEVCKLLLVVASGGVMCTRVDQVLKFYPASTIAALIVGAHSRHTPLQPNPRCRPGPCRRGPAAAAPLPDQGRRQQVSVLSLRSSPARIRAHMHVTMLAPGRTPMQAHSTAGWGQHGNTHVRAYAAGLTPMQPHSAALGAWACHPLRTALAAGGRSTRTTHCRLSPRASHAAARHPPPSCACTVHARRCLPHRSMHAGTIGGCGGKIINDMIRGG